MVGAKTIHSKTVMTPFVVVLQKQRKAILLKFFSEKIREHHFVVYMPTRRYIWPLLKPFIHAGSSVLPGRSFRGVIAYITTT